VKSAKEGSFWEHLEEFRARLFVMIVTISVLSAICFYFSKQITGYVTAAAPCPLIAISPAEAVTTHLKLSVTAGLILSSPVVLFQLWRFIAPGLYRNERRSVISVTVSGVILFLSGVAFAWFVMCKPALLLFQSFETGNIHGAWSVSGFTGFISSFVLMFGAAFQLPLAVVFVTRTGIIEPRAISKYRRHVIVGILIVAAILTPPDVLTQVMLAVPLYILFEFSLLVARISLRKAKSTDIEKAD
jgi:sec-independent protein translocase protein TatC